MGWGGLCAPGCGDSSRPSEDSGGGQQGWLRSCWRDLPCRARRASELCTCISGCSVLGRGRQLQPLLVFPGSVDCEWFQLPRSPATLEPPLLTLGLNFAESSCFSPSRVDGFEQAGDAFPGEIRPSEPLALSNPEQLARDCACTVGEPPPLSVSQGCGFLPSCRPPPFPGVSRWLFAGEAQKGIYL